MVDVVSAEVRSRMMSAIGTRNTRPEMALRRAIHAKGFRFRLHTKDLPGSPDLVFPRYRAVVFVHGCFWHRHQGCRNASIPKTRIEFWTQKFDANVARDLRVELALAQLGWRVATAWECEITKDVMAVATALAAWLTEHDEERGGRTVLHSEKSGTG